MWGSSHTGWDVSWTGGRGTVRRAEGASETLDPHGLLVRLTAIGWVAVVSLGGIVGDGGVDEHELWHGVGATAAQRKLRVELLDAWAAGREVLAKALDAVLDTTLALLDARNKFLGTLKTSGNVTLSWWWRWRRWTRWRWARRRWTRRRWTTYCRCTLVKSF